MSPKIIQPNATLRVWLSKPMIIRMQINAPKTLTTGAIGALNGLSRLGALTRKIQTPMLTKTNANRVPKLVKSTATWPGTNAAKSPTKTNRITFALYGVLYFG